MTRGSPGSHKSCGKYETDLISCSHNIVLLILGLLTWGILWCIYGDEWSTNGDWFRIAALAATAWVCGRIFQSLTGRPPCLAALFVGVLVRYLELVNMRNNMEIDMFFRILCPVVILGKASLGWDTDFMIAEWKRIIYLGTFPWISEVLTAALCVHYLLGFPWLWGFLLGSIYASLSCSIVLPCVLNAACQSRNTCRNWCQLVYTAGGLDTALSVGVFGLVHSYMFVEASGYCRLVKGVSTLFVGVIVGLSWGSLSKFIPHRYDYYVVELRVLFIFIGGLFGNLFFIHIGWRGVGGVAVLACNMTAAMHWRKEKRWKLNRNPAATAYRVMWATVEPVIFSFTGTYLDLDKELDDIMLVGLVILVACLAVRLSVTSLVCRDFPTKERIFICIVWTPKAIVEVILCPVAIITLASNGESVECEQMKYADNLLRLVLEAVIITTPLGYSLTAIFGPWLLSDNPTRHNRGDISCSSKLSFFLRPPGPEYAIIPSRVIRRRRREQTHRGSYRPLYHSTEEISTE